MFILVRDTEVVQSCTSRDLLDELAESEGGTVHEVEQDSLIAEGYVYTNGVLSETPEYTTEKRRLQRKDKFSLTIDNMNQVWYNSLTEDQKTRLATWRQEWLDYPETGTEPTTNVTDIFPD